MDTKAEPKIEEAQTPDEDTETPEEEAVEEKVEEAKPEETPAAPVKPTSDRSAYNCEPCKGEGLLENGDTCPACRGTGKR